MPPDRQIDDESTTAALREEERAAAVLIANNNSKNRDEERRHTGQRKRKRKTGKTAESWRPESELATRKKWALALLCHDGCDFLVWRDGLSKPSCVWFGCVVHDAGCGVCLGHDLGTASVLSAKLLNT